MEASNFKVMSFSLVIRLAVGVAAISITTACSTLNLDSLIAKKGRFNGQITNAGANQIGGLDDKISLPMILSDKAAKDPSNGTTVDAALKDFYAEKGANTDEWTVRRDRVQDRLLAASEERCNVYKIYLKNFDTETKSIFGVFSTVFAGAGAIATGQLNTRALSGLAAITSGSGAEITSAVFSNVATHLLIPGIDSRREEIHKEIEIKRGRLDEKYTMEAALLDAARYHGACTLDTGLRSASDSISEVNNVGVRRMNEVLRMASETKINLDAAAKGEHVQPVSGVTGRAKALYSNGAPPLSSQTPLLDLQDAMANASKRFRDLELAVQEGVRYFDDTKKGKGDLDEMLRSALAAQAAAVAEKAELDAKGATFLTIDEKKRVEELAAKVEVLKSKVKQINVDQELLQQDLVAANKRKTEMLKALGLVGADGVTPVVPSPLLAARDGVIEELKKQAGSFASLTLRLEQARQNMRGASDKKDLALAVEQEGLALELESVRLRRFLNQTYRVLGSSIDQVSTRDFAGAKKSLESLAKLKYGI